MKEKHGGNIREASEAAGVPAERIIDFSASVNPMGLSGAAEEAVARALKSASQYPDPDSCELRRALGLHHGIEQSQVIPANGSTELIYILPAFFNPRSALIVEPAFSEYRASLRLAGCRVDSLVLNEEDGFALDMAELAGRINMGCDIVYIANPANPTGVLEEKEKMLEAARICRDADTVLIVDEAFADFNEERSIKREAVALEGTVVLRSMTKFFSMAGLRLGYAIGERRTIKGLAGLIPPWSVNTPAAAAAGASLKDAAYMDTTREWLARERTFLSEGLATVPGLKVYSASANFVMVKITEAGLDAGALKVRLLKKGILIRDLSEFAGCGASFFRVSVRERAENALLVEALSTAMAEHAPAVRLKVTSPALHHGRG